MKLRISYEVNSKTLLPHDISISSSDRLFTFHVNQDGILSKITVTADVPDPEKFYSVITPTPEQYSKATFELKTDRELYDSVIRDFQDFESLLSLSYNVKSINWNTETYEVVCETEEEKQNAKIYCMEERGGFSDDPVSVSEEQLQETIDRKERLAILTVPVSFYREGKNEYYAMKFISAFYNFYFILEGMYGKGKTKNKDVLREFQKSSELRDFLKTILNEHIILSPIHQPQISRMLTSRKMTLTVDSVLDLIVRTRGELHHFTNNPNKIQNTPFNHRDFWSISFITMGLALHALLARIVEINVAAKPVITYGEKTEMADDEQGVYLDADDLLTAISQYLAKNNIKIRAGASFQWLITPEHGHKLPPIKDVSLRITPVEKKK